MRHFRDEQRDTGRRVFYSELDDPENLGIFADIRDRADALKARLTADTFLGPPREEHMASDNDTDRVWELMEKIGFCMLSTLDGEDIRSRPMAAHVQRDENSIYFLADVTSHKDDEIARNPNVGLAFADAGDQKYVSLTGRAEVSNDRQKIKELWSTPAKAWWQSPDEPSIRVLKITPKDAQYWDSPGTVLSYVKMFTATMTDAQPEIGDSAKVKL
jgi:general stress protein 26